MAMNRKYNYTDEQLKTAQRNGIPYGTFLNRVYKGWDMEKAMTKKPGEVKKIDDEDKKYRKMAEDNGISLGAYKSRLQYGWSKERAATEPIRKRKSAKITEEMIFKAASNGIDAEALASRLKLGWDIERATTQPKRKNPVSKNELKERKKELIETLGRIKYLRNIGVDYPPPITKLMQKRMDEYGIVYGDVKEVYVESEAFEEVQG